MWLVVLFSGIVAFFWYNAWVYSLPTVVPERYKAVNRGEHIQTKWHVRSGKSNAVFLHFFNPGCPCSRFNITQFRSLVKQYGNEVDFAVVVVSAGKKYTIREIQKKFHLQIPVFFDTALAVSCGVYSTPQAVIIDARDKLYYRGNYNKDRYCINKNSDYARIALDSLLQQKVEPVFSPFALTAYGCQLPK